MTPAAWPRDDPSTGRLLVVDAGAASVADAGVADLPALLRPRDLLVVNDAATLPASLHGRTARGEPLEARLCHRRGARTFDAVLFGAGDWRTRTEDRPPPPPLAPDDAIAFGPGLSARLVARDARSPRLVALRFDLDGDALAAGLQRHGRPVQYSHVRAPLEAWHVQTRYASRPWAMEPPSAGRPLTWELLAALRRRGVAIATVTHAAGLSSTGDAALDALLPFPERYDVPPSTVEAVAQARACAGRVVAVGTSVVRALEGCVARHGRLVAGEGVTDLRLGAGFRRRVVDALFTGVHEPGTSHFELLRAFAPDELLSRSARHAQDQGYLGHEFGDSMLVLPRT